MADPITLHVPPRALGVSNASPACLKLEAFLRLADIPYTRKACMNPAKGPTGKVPWVEDAGQAIGDSAVIIQHLKTTRGIDPDAGLNDEQLALSYAFTDLIEEGIYWAIVWSRWVDHQPGQPPLARDVFFGKIPQPMRNVIFWMIQRKCSKQLHQQGLLRHDRDHILARSKARIKALSDWLETRETMLVTDAPTTLDCTAWATICNLVASTSNTPFDDYARTLEPLKRYHAQMGKRLGFTE